MGMKLPRAKKPTPATGPNPRQASAPKPKYRNRKTKVGELTFDSAKEANRWRELQLLEQTLHIQQLRRQVIFRIRVNGVRVCDYTADFVYLERGLQVVEDVKGFRTPMYRLKRKLLKAALGIEIRET